MARYQKIHTHIWHDEKFTRLSEDGRTLFLYILTSPHSNAVGVFVLPRQYACADLQWDFKRFAEPFRELLREGVILYDETARLICINNHLKHNPMENENQAKAACKIIATLPKSPLYSTILKQLDKQYHEPLRIQLQERYGEPEAEAGTETGTETEAEAGRPEVVKIPFSEIVGDLNQKAGTAYKPTTKKTQDFIRARWNEGFREPDFFKVHDHQCAKWLTDAKMKEFLRPETIYGTKFEGYLNNAPVPGGNQNAKTTLSSESARDKRNRESNEAVKRRLGITSGNTQRPIDVHSCGDERGRQGEVVETVIVDP